MGILHREDAVGQQIRAHRAHLSLREADGANPQSGRLITQETFSPGIDRVLNTIEPSKLAQLAEEIWPLPNGNEVFGDSARATQK